MPSKNPEILKKHRDAWYRRNKSKQITRQLERRRELNLWLWAYKRTLSCADCGCSFKDHPEWLDFHHLDPNEKEGHPKDLIKSSRQAVLREVEKCVPLCANCHRTRHTPQDVAS